MLTNTYTHNTLFLICNIYLQRQKINRRIRYYEAMPVGRSTLLCNTFEPAEYANVQT
jgi:hypothetical protein